MISPHLEEAHALALPHVTEEVVKPETLAKWRQWGVPEEIIETAIRQRQTIRNIRQAEEWIKLPHFAYKMPRLQEIEANAWGFAKAIDFEGYIIVSERTRRDRVARTDRWLYRYEYHTPRVGIATRSYEPIEEIANMMHVSVRIRQYQNTPLYSADSFGARAVRICYLIQPHLKIPQKQTRTEQVLNTFTQRPATRI